ncbi:MAG TPA: hypothetical protein VIA18_26600 [Polyangia bacterium]|jgi:hypothetical protein|nr:hypothetical protein [Polyangia bacterium]HWE29043.1 hypothetical protein [Polyangia bacterium]
MADQKMCQQCGTLIDANDPSGLCANCGKSASTGEGDGEHHNVAPPLVHTDEPHGTEPMETFPQSPPGTSGYEANPELKVRR